MRVKYLPAVLILSLLTGCATFRAGAPEGAIDVIAHRGASQDAPENTLTAFRLAREMGADWVELDAHLTKDGEVVVMHDSKLERTTGDPGTVEGADLAYLKSLDAGAWKGPRFAGESIPTLAECLDFARGNIGVYVEIKNCTDETALMGQVLQEAEPYTVMTPACSRQIMKAIEASGTPNLDLTRKTIALIRERRMENGVVIQSFSPIICAIARIEAPEMRVELLSGVKPEEHDVWELVTRWLFLLDLDGLNISHESMTPGRMAAIKQAGKSVAVWTVDEPGVMLRAVGFGADSIITNCPDRALRTLGRS